MNNDIRKKKKVEILKILFLSKYMTTHERDWTNINQPKPEQRG